MNQNKEDQEKASQTLANLMNTMSPSSAESITLRLDLQTTTLWHKRLQDIGEKLFRKAAAISILNKKDNIDEECINIAFNSIKLGSVKYLDTDKWYDDSDDNW